MNQTEKTVLLANAIVSEVFSLRHEKMSLKAFDALSKAKVKDAEYEVKEMLTERLHTATLGKNILQTLIIVLKMSYFARKQTIEIRQLAELATCIAEDLVERKTVSELATMGLESINIPKAIITIVEDAAIKAGI